MLAKHYLLITYDGIATFGYSTVIAMLSGFYGVAGYPSA